MHYGRHAPYNCRNSSACYAYLVPTAEAHGKLPVVQAGDTVRLGVFAAAVFQIAEIKGRGDLVVNLLVGAAEVDRAADVADLFRLRPDVRAVEDDLPFVRLQETVEHLHERGFAAARAAGNQRMADKRMDVNGVRIS